MESMKIELPRMNNVFSYVMVVSTIVFLYSMSFEIRSMYQGLFTQFNKIVVLSFVYSGVSAVFWQINGCLMALEKDEKNREILQMGLMAVFIVVLASILYFVRV